MVSGRLSGSLPSSKIQKAMGLSFWCVLFGNSLGFLWVAPWRQGFGRGKQKGQVARALGSGRLTVLRMGAFLFLFLNPGLSVKNPRKVQLVAE